MKKILCTLSMVIISGFLLVGCTGVSRPVRDKTEEIFTAIQNGDDEYLINFSNMYGSEEQLEYMTYENIIDRFKPYAEFFRDNFKYEIVEVDEEKMTSKVSVTYIEADQLYEYVDWNNEEDEVEDTIAEAIKQIDTSETVTKTINLEFEDNDGTIDLKEIPDKLYNVVIWGQYDLIADIFNIFSIY